LLSFKIIITDQQSTKAVSNTFKTTLASTNKILVLFKKDLLLEIRQQYTFYGILLYIASTIFVLYLAMGQPEATAWNGLFWMNLLFICINAVAKSFLQESRGRMLYYYSIAGALDFILAKLLYNVLLMLVMSLLSLLMFSFFLGSPLLNNLQFIGITVLGGISISLVFTLLAAIAARANQNAALMAILGFPLIIPQLLLLVKISKSAFGEVFNEGALSQLVLLLSGLDIMVVFLSLILFPFLWKD
jgi:heme exporter protein B